MASTPDAFRVAVVSEGESEDGPKTAVIQVWGELDIATSPMLADAIQSATTTEGARVVVDLSTVQFIDSSGVSALVVSANRARERGGMLVVRNPAPMARRIFAVLGLGDMLRIEDTSSLRSECPSCASGWPDEYTHGDCPPGSSRADHRHLKCLRCGQEWVEALPGPIIKPG